MKKLLILTLPVFALCACEDKQVEQVRTRVYRECTNLYYSGPTYGLSDNHIVNICNCVADINQDVALGKNNELSKYLNEVAPFNNEVAYIKNNFKSAVLTIDRDKLEFYTIAPMIRICFKKLGYK